jgi:hypothetical protein
MPNYKKEMRLLKEQTKNGKQYPYQKIVDAIDKKSKGATVLNDIKRMNILEHFFYVACGQSSASDGSFHNREQIMQCISATISEAMKRLNCKHLSAEDKASCDYHMIEQKKKEENRECQNIPYTDNVARMECYNKLYEDNPQRKDYKAKVLHLCRTHFCNAKDNIDERCTKLNACTDYASSWRDIYPDSKKYFALIYASLKLDKGAANLKKFSKKLNPKNIGKKVTRKFKPGTFMPAYKKREKAILKNMLVMYEEKKKRGDIFIKESKNQPDFSKYMKAKKFLEGSKGEGLKSFGMRALTLGSKKSRRNQTRKTNRQLERHRLSGRNNGKTARLKKEQQALKQQQYEAKKTMENLEKSSPIIQKYKNFEDLGKIIKLIKQEIASDGKKDLPLDNIKPNNLLKNLPKNLPKNIPKK